MGSKNSSPVSVLSPNVPDPVHPLADSWDAAISLVNFHPRQQQKISAAISLIKKVIRSQEFKERILKYSRNGKTGFVDSNGRTNAEIYQLIMEGAEEKGNTSRNNKMDVELELYHQMTSTIGYTYPNTVRIWMNSKYFDQYDAVKVADNLMHEWMHKIGFTHAMAWTEDRDHSVPYAIGYLVEELATKLE